VTYHPNTDGSEAKFEMRHESDGSQRVIDLLPAFLELSARVSRKVCVIDEVDRSLHTLLTRRLLEAYLSKCSTETRSQLLLTTHDVLLMDQQLLRRDELWVTERDASGASTLLSFSEYKDVRYDKDIRKSYLQGRLGGIPRILLGSDLTNACLTSGSEANE
jgi:AAA15 family ATPase/GTPase